MPKENVITAWQVYASSPVVSPRQWQWKVARTLFADYYVHLTSDLLDIKKNVSNPFV